jgi:hypothetical protein
MPWAAAEPQELEQKVALIRTFHGQFDLSIAFVYGIFSRDESRVGGRRGFQGRLRINSSSASRARSLISS